MVVFALESIPQEFDGGLVHWEFVDKMLILHTHSQSRVAPNFASSRINFPGHELQ
jgi:hypothetical protein